MRPDIPIAEVERIPSILEICHLTGNPGSCQISAQTRLLAASNSFPLSILISESFLAFFPCFCNDARLEKKQESFFHEKLF
jgi:hypothetical protein